MKRLNNSQPLAVAVQYAPLNTSMKIVPQGGMSTMQFYRQTTQQWIPDHTHAYAYDENGALVDGPLMLMPEWSIIDTDNVLDTSALYPTVFWYVDDMQITDTNATKDFYLSGNALVVRKNFTHLKGGVVYCELHFTDTRTGSPFVLSDSIPLSAILHADEQWSIQILNDRTRKHFPLAYGDTQYAFEAAAYIGSNEKTDVVTWFWDFSEDNGVSWNEIDGDCLWYVSGKNSNILTIDMDFTENILLRCRINTSPTGTKPDIPNEATASIAWRFPALRPVVYSYGGDRVIAETSEMTFGLIVHNPKHSDLSLAQQREWLLCDWILRKQGSKDTPMSLAESDVMVSVSDKLLRNSSDIKYIADPQCSLRGPFAKLQTSSGDDIQSSSELTITARS